MVQDEFIKLFYKFLVENNALFNYLKYANFEKLKNISVNEFIACIAIWNRTDEGFNYWNKLDYKWLEKLKQNNLYEHN